MPANTSCGDYGEVTGLRASLAVAERRVEALQRACGAAARGLGDAEALDAVLDAAALLVENASVYACTRVDPTLWLLVGHRGNLRPDTQTTFRHGEGLVGRAAASGLVEPSPLAIDATTIAVPVNSAEEVVAVLCLDRGNGPAFSPDDLAAALGLADVVGQLFRTGRLRREIQRMQAERSSIYRLARGIGEADSVQCLLDLVMPSLTHILSARAGLIYLLPSQSGNSEAVSTKGIGPETTARLESLLKWWMSALGPTPGGPLILTQPRLSPVGSLMSGKDNPSSLLLAGISAAGRVIGAAGFERIAAIDGPYTSSDADLLAGMVSQLATAVENVRLRAYDISAFHELSQFPGAAHTMEEICDRILEKIGALFPCQGCWLSTVDRDDGKPQLRASRGLKWGSGRDQGWLSLECLNALPRGRPDVWLIDRSQSSLDVPWPSSQASTAAVAAMQAQGSYVGAIVLVLERGQELNAQRQLLLASLASQAGLVIRSAGLLMAAQELVVQEERSRIASEIHDGVSQNLALLMLRMEIISRLAHSDPQLLKAELHKVRTILESSVHELRRSIYALRSPDLARLGLLAALNRLARDFTEQTNLDVTLVLPPGLPLPLQAQSSLFSIVQERLDALVKDGSATRVSLAFELDDDHLSVQITDNGRNLLHRSKDAPTSVSPWQTRLESHVKPYGGSVRLFPEQKGTRVEINVPLRNR